MPTPSQATNVTTQPCNQPLPPRQQKLDLSDNTLHGSVPDLSTLDELETLSLDNNKLTGGVPSSLGRCAALKHLSLSQVREIGLPLRVPCRCML